MWIYSIQDVDILGSNVDILNRMWIYYVTKLSSRMWIYYRKDVDILSILEKRIQNASIVSQQSLNSLLGLAPSLSYSFQVLLSISLVYVRPSGSPSLSCYLQVLLAISWPSGLAPSLSCSQVLLAISLVYVRPPDLAPYLSCSLKVLLAISLVYVRPSAIAPSLSYLSIPSLIFLQLSLYPISLVSRKGIATVSHFRLVLQLHLFLIFLFHL